MNSKGKLVIILASLFFASLLLRFWWTQLDLPLHDDEIEYHFLAQQILQGNGFVNEYGQPTAWRTPGYPLFVASIYKLFGTEISSMRIILIIFSASISIFVYLLTYFLFRRHITAFISSLGWTFLPNSIFLAGNLWGESVTAFFLVVSFVLVINFKRKVNKVSFIATIVSGLLVGMAILTRGYMIFIILALPFYLLFYEKSKKLAMVCLIFSALIPSIWLMRNAIVLHSFTLSTETAQVIWHGSNRWARGGWNGEWFNHNSEQKDYLIKKYPGFFDQLTDGERSKIYLKEAINEIPNNPLRILWLTPRKIAIFLSPSSYLGFDWIYLFSLPFAFSGFFILLRSKTHRPKLWLLAFPILCVAVVCVITFGDPRFRHPVDFCFLILASVGLVDIIDKLRVLVKTKSPSAARPPESWVW